jgi:hypothetical protein
MGMGVQRHALAALRPGKTRYPSYRRLGQPHARSGRVRKNLAPIGIRAPDRPARSESLYRLSYPGPQWKQRRQQHFSLYFTENKFVSGVMAGRTMVYGELILFIVHIKWYMGR